MGLTDLLPNKTFSSVGFGIAFCRSTGYDGDVAK